MTLRDKVRSCEIRKTLNIESLPSKSRDLTPMMVRPCDQNAPGTIAEEVLLATPKGERPIGWPRTGWCDYNSNLAWPRLGVEPAELSEIAENREVFRFFLELLRAATVRATLPTGKASMKINE